MLDVIHVGGTRLAGVCACLPARVVDNCQMLLPLYGEKTAGVVKSTGVRSRRLAEAGVTPIDLCATAAERLLDDLSVDRESVGAVICVSFTQPERMPAAACQVQARLGLSDQIIAFDVGLACSGWGYGLYLAETLARDLQKPVLLLDGDVQSAFMKENDAATLPVLADAGTATLVEPAPDAAPTSFAFLCNGAGGNALRLERGGTIAMDGFEVFRFVSVDVLRFLRRFLSAVRVKPDQVDLFVPHQANVFMVNQLAKALDFPMEKVGITADRFGNSASASVPVTLATCGKVGSRVLVSGFGGGLSAYAATVTIDEQCLLVSFDTDGTDLRI